MRTDTDTGKPGEVGVVGILVPNSDGTLRLVLDDLDQIPDTNPTEWRTRALFTFKDYDKRRLIDGRLTKDELAEIGENIVIRLAALGGLIK